MVTRFLMFENGCEITYGVFIFNSGIVKPIKLKPIIRNVRAALIVSILIDIYHHC